MKILDVTAGNRVPFRVVLYAPGETGPYPAAKDEERAKVEFYDGRYPHTEHGQFTGGRYYAASLANGTGGGLILDGGIADWRLDKATYDLVLAWLRHHEAGFRAANSGRF